MIDAAKQFTRALWRRLQRASTAVSLVVLLSLGALEPLLCVIHCEIMALRMDSEHMHASAGNYLCAFAQQPSMQLQIHAGSALMTSTTLPSHLHALGSNESGIPTTSETQPQPFHEMAMIAGALLLIILVLWRKAGVPMLAPLQHFFRPPLHPPIASLCWNMA